MVGWPVAHSRSPAMQNAALRATGHVDWRYQLLPVPPELFEQTVRALPAAGLRGVNVTIPHKHAALALCDQPSARARAIGAANTLVFERDGAIAADNTDAPALVAALPFPMRGRTALVLGAGGSARAAVWALLHAGAAQVSVHNRTPQRARALCAELGGGTPVSVLAAADLLVHCTPVGLHAGPGPGPGPSSGAAAAGGGQASGEQLPLPTAKLADYTCVVDFVYRDGGTPLLRAARALGIEAVDGLALLSAQGALRFVHFTGHTAPVAAMRAALGLPSV